MALSAWQLIYAVAGVGAIIALTAYLILDALAIRRAYLGRSGEPRTVWPARWSAIAAILVVLWLTAAVLR